MGLYVRQNEDRSQLQSKIASDLQQKLKDKQRIETPKQESTFLDDRVQTNGIGIIAVILGIIIAGILLYLLRP